MSSHPHLPATGQLPVAVIGAGPTGLAAAAHLQERGLPFVVLEAGSTPGAAVQEWSHVQFFSPWRFATDAAARRLLTADGWQEPPADDLPRGDDLLRHYLVPLAAHPSIAPRLRFDSRVVAIAREGVDRLRTAGRERTPFVLHLAGGQSLRAAAVIDASGTWRTPNPLGADGLSAAGETRLHDRLDPALPDVLGAGRAGFAGAHTVVVGAGHSAANTLLALTELADQERGTSVTWAVRRDDPTRAFGGGNNDELAARGALGSGLNALVTSGKVHLVSGFGATRLEDDDSGRLRLTGRSSSGRETTLAVDRVVVATGFRPDHSITTELRLDLDPVLEAPRALAPLIDPNEHSCGTVRPHGAQELAHPEPGFFTVGMKSYGRAPTFLLATGYEQVRSVVAHLVGDLQAAHAVELLLPATGVCCTSGAATGGC